MHGLTVRWSLEDAPDGVEEALSTYVRDTSHARFTGKEQFSTTAAESPGSQIVGSAPVLIEPCRVVAVAEGGSGFLAAPTYA